MLIIVIFLLPRRKIQLEADKQQRDADLRIRSGEVQTLQKEYEAISSTTQQLERQRGKSPRLWLKNKF